MTIQLYANNAKTTLASAITSTQTSITVAPGTGAEFPNPTTGQAFKITLVSATSSSTYEICLCTSISGDTLTIVRAQEGTTALPFLLNDIVGNFDTAAVMADLVQSEQLQTMYYEYAVATGSANAITSTIPSNLTAVTDGMSIIIKSAYANTGATTLNLTLGSTSTGVIPIVKGNNTSLIAGDIPAAGYPLSLTYSSTFSAWVLTDASVVLTPYALINSQAFTGTPTVPTAPYNDDSYIIANTQWVQNQLANYAPIYSPTFTGTPFAPTASTGTNTNQIATTAFVQANLGLGYNQTWQNVTSSRVAGTTYTNSTGKPIMVSAYINGFNSDLPNIAIVVNGLTINDVDSGTGVGSIGVYGIVPNGSTYSVVVSTGGVSVTLNWYELR